MPRIRAADWGRALLLPSIVAGLYLLARRFGFDEWMGDREAIQARLAGWGIAAPFVFVGCYSIFPLVFIPRAFLALIGGYLFGWPSVIYTWLGALIGESIAFALASTLGRPLVEKAVLKSARAQRPVGWLKREGFWAVLIMRLFPFMPTDAINFGSGIAGVKYRDFAAGTLLGILPGCIVFSYYGQLFEGKSIELIYSIPLFLLPMLLALGVARMRYGRRVLEREDSGEPAEGRESPDRGD